MGVGPHLSRHFCGFPQFFLDCSTHYNYSSPPDTTDASAYHARVGFRLWTFLGLGFPTDFPSLSLTLQPTTNIPPPRHGQTPLHIMHASVLVSGPRSGLAHSIFQTCGTTFFLVLGAPNPHSTKLKVDGLGRNGMGAMLSARWREQDGSRPYLSIHAWTRSCLSLFSSSKILSLIPAAWHPILVLGVTGVVASFVCVSFLRDFFKVRIS